MILCDNKPKILYVLGLWLLLNKKKKKKNKFSSTESKEKH